MPTSLYRASGGSFGDVDVFDPEEQAKLEKEIRRMCLANQKNPNLIGSFWCNPIDSKPGFKQSGIKQGIFDHGLKPRPELNQALRELNQFLDQKTPKS